MADLRCTINDTSVPPYARMHCYDIAQFKETGRLRCPCGHEVEVPVADEEERQREDEYVARREIERTVQIARDNLKRMLPGEPFSDELGARIVRHMRLARDLGQRNPKFIELVEELKSVITDEQPNEGGTP